MAVQRRTDANHRCAIARSDPVIVGHAHGKLAHFHAFDLKIAHMGDLGHEPDLKQYAALAGTDVMMIPIGGFYTIDTETALKVIAEVKPKVVIPMHFKTEVMNFPITDEKQFAEATGAAYWDKSYIDITRDNIDSLPNAVVLKYKD